MTLTVVLNKQSGREWITSFDTVCGTVVFVNKRSIAIRAISIWLEGMLKVAS